MRVMAIMKASKESEAGQMPSQALLTAMGQFNEELVKAGIMLDGEGLHPSSKGKRVRFDGSSVSVVDGPFAETKELVAGFYLIEARDMDEALAIASRIPAAPLGTIEVWPTRQLVVDGVSRPALG
jgi:hypothetical protein